MAKYDREFLVPYLQDVCTLHFAQLEVGCKMIDVQKEILRLKHGREIEAPAEPDYEEEWNLINGVLAGIGVLFMLFPAIALLGILLDGYHGNQVGLVIVMSIIVAPMGLLMWKAFGLPVKLAQKRNEVLYEQYQEELLHYQVSKKEVEESNAVARKRIPNLEKRLEFYSLELKKISKLLEMAYNAAVLPTQYRDVYAATYLYDYFSNSRADDLDQVLNTYVLEQIKDKLDVIIENQRTSILHQRMILVNQQRTLEEQRAHNAYMRRKIGQIAANVEEQGQYLSMVECNTAATAYFAAASYLK